MGTAWGYSADSDCMGLFRGISTSPFPAVPVRPAAVSAPLCMGCFAKFLRASRTRQDSWPRAHVRPRELVRVAAMAMERCATRRERRATALALAPRIQRFQRNALSNSSATLGSSAARGRLPSFCFPTHASERHGKKECYPQPDRAPTPPRRHHSARVGLGISRECEFVGAPPTVGDRLFAKPSTNTSGGRRLACRVTCRVCRLSNPRANARRPQFLASAWSSSSRCFSASSAHASQASAIRSNVSLC
jgi:hypothetical protein